MRNYTESNELSEMEKVEKSINAFPDLEVFSVFSLNALKTLPSSIGKLKKLNQLNISFCRSFEEFPAELADLKLLRSLSITSSQHKKLPKGLAALTNLRKLTLKGNLYSAKTGWEALCNLKGIESLELSHSIVKMKSELPKEIFGLHKLQFLYLDNNRLKKLPFEIGQLKELLLLDLGYNIFTEFPEELLFLPKLESLTINAEAINNVPFELFEIPTLKELKITGRNSLKYPLVTTIEKLFYASKSKHLQRDFINLILSVLKYPNLIEELELNELIQLLNCEIEQIVFRSLQRLENMLSSSFSAPNRDSIVLISGKTFENKAQLKSSLDKRGIKTASKFNDKITHILLSPDMKTESFKYDGSLVFMTEKLLKDSLDFSSDQVSIFDDEEDEQSIEKIASLINSDSDSNNLIALNLLKAGFKEVLTSDLVFLYKKSSNNQIRKLCIDLLKKFGQLELALNLKRRLPLTSVEKEKNLSNNLAFYCSFYGVNPLRLLKLIYQKSKKGLHFGMMQLNSNDKKIFFDDIIKDGILDLSKTELEKLPVDFGIFSTQIKTLNLSYNNFSEFPLAGLLSLKNLSELNFLNDEVWYYPDELSGIENLKKLQVKLSFESRVSTKLLSALKSKGVKIILASK